MQDALLDDDLLDSMQALNDKRAKSTTKSTKTAPELIYLDSRAPSKAKAIKKKGGELDLWAASGVERTEVRATATVAVAYVAKRVWDGVGSRRGVCQEREQVETETQQGD